MNNHCLWFDNVFEVINIIVEELAFLAINAYRILPMNSFRLTAKLALSLFCHLKVSNNKYLPKCVLRKTISNICQSQLSLIIIDYHIKTNDYE